MDTRAAFVARVPKGEVLLDLGTSDGSTLSHIAELRPDLRLAAVDMNASARLPPTTDFQRANLERDALKWGDGSIGAITCMHVVEHLRDHSNLFREAARLLKPGGLIYVETPGPKSLTTPSATGAAGKTVTLNFFDDPTHVGVVETRALERMLEAASLTVERSGVSRNWLFAAAYPLLRVVLPRSRKRWIAKLHWSGWSHFVIAQKR